VTDVAKWAQVLLDAADQIEAIAPITDSEPDLTVEEGYEIQAELLARRLARGERLVGAKLGLTSRAKQEQMKVAEPVYGWLTDAMILAAEAPLERASLIHPRAEPEIAFVLGRDLAGPGLTAHDVLAATAGVCCALEIIDSRYADFRFTAADVIADNTSAARFVLGPARVAPTFDLSLVGCLLEQGGQLITTAAGAAVLGHPAEAVALLANALGRQGRALEAGWVVLSGGMTPAVPVEPGVPVAATFGRGLGRVGVRAFA
jgi:2-oxo-3-hexenedioate decarboxylase